MMALQERIDQAEKWTAKQEEAEFRVLTMRMLHGIMYLLYRNVEEGDLVAEEGARKLLQEAERYIMALGGK